MRKLFLGTAIAACSAVGLHAADVAAQEAPGSVDVEWIETTQVGQQQVYAVYSYGGGTAPIDFGGGAGG